MNQGEALEILEIIKAFFDAIIAIFKALGLIKTEEEPNEETSAEA